MARKLALAGLVAVSLAALAATSRAAEPAPAAASESAVDPAASAALARASEFLRAQSRFAFSADIAYEVLQEDGTTLEFGELRRYVVRRPDKLRIESDRRAGGRRVMFFDGERITVSSPSQNAYAFVRLKQHRSLDDALHILRDRIGLPVPLGELLASEPAKGVESTFDSGFVVGDEVLDGVASEHVALRNEDTDIEVWIAKAAQPYVQRVRISYHSLPGQPRFAARISDWSLTPDVADSVFEFDPPANAERVRFAFGGSGAPPPAEEKKP